VLDSFGNGNDVNRTAGEMHTNRCNLQFSNWEIFPNFQILAILQIFLTFLILPMMPPTPGPNPTPPPFNSFSQDPHNIHDIYDNGADERAIGNGLIIQ
jgi:hypothetical protein